MYNFNQLIANALENNALWSDESDNTTKRGLLQGVEGATKEVKIFQPIAPFAKTPLILENYRPGNGNNPAYSFSKLADHIPKIARCFEFNTTPFSVQLAWEMILIGEAKSEFTRKQFEKARGYFQDTVKPDPEGRWNHNWRITEAEPADWYDSILDVDNLTPIILSIPENGAQSKKKSSSFVTLESVQVPEWNTRNENVSVSDESKIKTIRVNVLIVTISRKSWYYDNLLLRNDWCIRELEEGHYSTGTLENNYGEFPLLPTHIIIAGKTEIDAFWAKADEQLITQNANSLSLDSFILGSESEPATTETVEGGMTRISSTTPYVLGYISKLMPKCPPMSGLSNEA